MTKSNSTTISIIGCGWLGLPLAEHLITQGYTVKGSTTNKDKVAILESKNIEAYLLKIGENGLEGNNISALFHSDIVFVNIPPRARRAGVAAIDRHFKEMNHLLTALKESPIQHLIFASATSVYNDCNTTVTESTSLFPTSVSGKTLLPVEQLFQKQNQFTTTVLRFGGLLGGNRHPARFLSGRKDLKNGNAPVNLVHLEDCIGVVYQLITQKKWGGIYNIVADEHPTRQEYYTQAALNLGLTPPNFANHTTNGKWKIVDNSKIKQALNYTFRSIENFVL